MGVPEVYSPSHYILVLFFFFHDAKQVKMKNRKKNGDREE